MHNINLPFTVESMKQVFAWGASPDTAPFTHQEIAHWCDSFHMAMFDVDTDNAMDIATGIAADVDAQWDMLLASRYTCEELQKLDFSKEQVPAVWFREWISQLENASLKEPGGRTKRTP